MRHLLPVMNATGIVNVCAHFIIAGSVFVNIISLFYISVTRGNAVAYRFASLFSRSLSLLLNGPLKSSVEESVLVFKDNLPVPDPCSWLKKFTHRSMTGK